METTNSQIVASAKALAVILLVRRAIEKSPTGVTFFSVKNYQNKQGEISDNLINIGVSYDKSKEKDIAFLEQLDVTTLENVKSDKVTLMKAKTELIEAFKNPDENRSQGQKDAYTTIVNGVKVHNETGVLYIWGYRVNKTVIKEGVYKSVKSSEMTIAKNELRKLLRTGKYTQYALEVGNELTAKGDTIEL